MSLLTWNPQYAIGVRQIDDQHMKLVDILNRLHEGMLKGHPETVLGKVLNDLVEYTVMHFATEEHLMQQYAYPGTVAHRKEHADLIAGVQEKIGEAKANGNIASISLLKFLKAWLQGHILGSDKRFAVFLNTKGVH